jgi:MFS family permease
MNSVNAQDTPLPPSLMKALTAGFDAISNHIGLILFSLTLDFLLWCGPHLRLVGLFQSLLRQGMVLPDVQSRQVLEKLQEAIQGYNLFSILRTFPVGVPSLMAIRFPMETPLGKPLIMEIPSAGVALVLWILLTIIGLMVGTLYFSVVAQAAIDGRVAWRQALNQWPWACLQVTLLAAAWFALLLALFVPFSCLLSMLLLSGIGIEQVTLFSVLIFLGFLVWLLVPLIFSPHGIFVKQHAVWIAVIKSVRLTRLTFPSTTLLLLVLLILSEGLDMLWNVPDEMSWLMLIGIIGHAFINSGLLAASFIYYRDADSWVEATYKARLLSA